MAESRRIVVTGATRGLGRAMVRSMIDAGHVVAGCGRSANAVAELTEEFGTPHRFDPVDVSCDDDVRQWAGRVIDQSGPPDLLLNNAAIINQNAPLWEVGAGEFDTVMQVNICGVANVIRHFVPAMIERGSGIIVNFSSGWGRSTSSDVGPYCTSKWAIEGLTRALAQELPRGMAAVPLNPGVINTDMLQSCWADGAASYPAAADWARYAVPYILAITPDQNGNPLAVSP